MQDLIQIRTGLIHQFCRPYQQKFAWWGPQFFGVGAQHTDPAECDIRGDYGALAGWVRPGHAPNDGANHTYFGLMPINAAPGSYIQLAKINLNFVGLYMDDGGGIQLCHVAATALNWAQNVWHHAGIIWHPDRSAFFIDGAAAAELSPANTGAAALPAGALIYESFALQSAMSDLARLRVWRQPPPDEHFAWLFNNERGIFGV